MTGVLACLGLLYELGVVRWAQFSLDFEYTPASIWLALLLVAAAAAATTARGHRALMLCEETLEMLGSTLFATGFALLAVAATARAPRRRDDARVG